MPINVTPPAIMEQQPTPEVTTLTPQEEQAFQRWLSDSHIQDANVPDAHYDYRGLFKELQGQPVPVTNDRHFPDTYKQHGHPTFSVESKYSKGPNDGGTWNGEQYTPQTPLMSEMISRELAKQTAHPQAPKQKSILEQIGTPAFAAGAGADWLSTAMGLSNGMQERNPMINWVPSNTGKVALGAGIDLAGYLLAKHLLKNHPKLLNAGLLGSGVYRGAIAASNMHKLGQQTGNK